MFAYDEIDELVWHLDYEEKFIFPSLQNYASIYSIKGPQFSGQFQVIFFIVVFHWTMKNLFQL